MQRCRGAEQLLRFSRGSEEVQEVIAQVNGAELQVQGCRFSDAEVEV